MRVYSVTVTRIHHLHLTIFYSLLTLFWKLTNFGAAMTKSAASAASPEGFQAVIESAASAASPNTKSRGPSSRGACRPPSSASRAAVRRSTAAWSPAFGLRGVCASRRLDHDLKTLHPCPTVNLLAGAWSKSHRHLAECLLEKCE